MNRKQLESYLFTISLIVLLTITITGNNQLVFAVESQTDLYKKASTTAKTTYSNLIQNIDTTKKMTEDLLSNSMFENNDAKQKIKSAWTDIWYANKSFETIKRIHEKSSEYHSEGKYKLAYSTFLNIDKELNSIILKLSSVSTKITDANKLEDKFQGQKRSCFISWCFYENRNVDLDSQVKELDKKIRGINSQKDVSREESKLFTQKLQALKTGESFDKVEQKQTKVSTKAKETQNKNNDLTQEVNKIIQGVLGEDKKTIEKLTKEKLDAEKKAQFLKEQANREKAKAEQEKQRLLEQVQQREYEAQQREYQAQQERQYLIEQQELEEERNRIRLQANSSPLIKGLINGELRFYVTPLPSYVSQDVRNRVESLASWMDGTYIHGVELKRVYSNSADFTVNWVRDYQEDAIGRQIGSHLIVGLGKNNCIGEWKPFNGYSVYKIMWHEVGHALGYGHVNDVNNIMSGDGTGTKFEYDYSSDIVLSDGYANRIPLCDGGDYFIATQTTNPHDGYKLYITPPNSDMSDVLKGKSPVYLSCSSYENEMMSAPSNCRVEYGSAVVIHNPSTFGVGSDVIVNVKIYDRNPDRELDLELPNSSLYYSQEYLDHVRSLFHN